MKIKAKPSVEFQRFNALVGRVLSTPKAVIDQLKEEEKQAKLNPKKRDSKKS